MASNCAVALGQTDAGKLGNARPFRVRGLQLQQFLAARAGAVSVAPALANSAALLPNAHHALAEELKKGPAVILERLPLVIQRSSVNLADKIHSPRVHLACGKFFPLLPALLEGLKTFLLLNLGHPSNELLDLIGVGCSVGSGIIRVDHKLVRKVLDGLGVDLCLFLDHGIVN